ncbi:MAG: hypothetical protein GY711_02165 [bacterium]|nr:hypothetical protein [bacterium]
MRLLLIACLTLTLALHSSEVPAALRPLYEQPHGDKLVHVIIGCVLACVANLAFADACVRVQHRRFLLGSSLTLLVLAGFEGIQILVPHRVFDPLDVACSAFGVFLAGRIPALRKLDRTAARLS